MFVDDVIDALLRCLHGGASSRQTYQLGGPQVYTLREIVSLVASITRQRRWIIGLAGLPAARLQALVMDFVPGRPFSSDNYRSLTVDSVCTENGFAQLKLHPALDGGCAAAISRCAGRQRPLEPRSSRGRPVQGRS